MTEKDEIAALFKSKLSGHTEPVDPAVWTTLQQGLGVAGKTAGGITFGKSLGLIKLVAIASGIIGASIWVMILQNEPSQKPVLENNQIGYQPTVSDNAAVKALPNTAEQITLQSKNQHQTESLPGELNQPVSDVTNNPRLYLEKTDYQPFTETKTVDGDKVAENESKPLHNALLASQAGSISSESTTKPTGTQESGSDSNKLLINTIPNIFTPNADGKNDYFNIPVAEHATHETKIFNVEGDLVAAFNEKSIGWDGNLMDGSEASNGTYIYVTFVTDPYGIQKPFKGSLILKR